MTSSVVSSMFVVLLLDLFLVFPQIDKAFGEQMELHKRKETYHPDQVTVQERIPYDRPPRFIPRDRPPRNFIPRDRPPSIPDDPFIRRRPSLPPRSPRRTLPPRSPRRTLPPCPEILPICKPRIPDIYQHSPPPPPRFSKGTYGPGH